MSPVELPEAGEALRRLAIEAGIHESYWDIAGQLHVASDDTRRTLLAAMGIPAATDAEALQSLKLWRERRWRQPLPPVAVLRRGEPKRFCIEVALPERRAAEPLEWSVELEAGGAVGGKLAAEALEIAETGEIDGIPLARRRLPLPPMLPEGYHTLTLNFAGRASRCPLIVAPAAAYVPPWMEAGERRWGLATQVYALRREGDWGVGDFTALGELLRQAESLGARIVGINPLHALFPTWPDACSPYSPSNPEFLNPLMIDVDAIPLAARSPQFQAFRAEPEVAAALDAARACELIDYPAVSDLKYRALALIYDDFLSQPEAPENAAFEAFCEAGGARLARFAEFSALHETMGGLPWNTWAVPFQNPAAPEVEAFALANAERVTFHAFLQWLAEVQLAAAAAAAPEVGLYRDLAVGVNAEGASAWANQEDIVRGISVGAPPDAFSPVGQDWGLPPPNPHRMRETAYAGFVALLRANMRHAAALRLDHVMGLMRLFWIPQGIGVTGGAYVSYPFDDLLAIVALESRRNRCLVVGEDLGTVPDDFRGRMEAERLLSYRVLYFERWDSGLFKRPDAYPPLALVTPTTHDMPTIAGHWLGLDLALRTEIGIYADETVARRETEGRAAEREALIAALADQNLLPEPPPSSARGALAALTSAVLRYAARTPARLLVVNLGDLLVEATQINLPGTVNEHPNWRRRMPEAVATLAAHPLIRAGVAALREER